MKLEDVLQLLVVIGGTVGITFQIAWAIFKEIHNNSQRELTIVGSTFSIFSIVIFCPPVKRAFCIAEQNRFSCSSPAPPAIQPSPSA